MAKTVHNATSKQLVDSVHAWADSAQTDAQVSAIKQAILDLQRGWFLDLSAVAAKTTVASYATSATGVTVSLNIA